MTELPTQEQFVRFVRDREIKRAKTAAWICSGFGFTYIIIGVFFFLQLVRYSDDFAFLFFAPCFSWGLAKIFGEWIFPIRCSVCGKRLKDSSLAIALHSCPRCHHKLFSEQFFSRITLPELRSVEQMMLYSFLLSFLLLLLLLKWADWTGRAPNMIQYFQWILIVGGVLLALGPIVLRFCKKRSPGLRFKSKRCPICGELDVFIHRHYTGNCSVCGSQIDPDWPPAEPEPLADLPTWDKLKTLRRCPYCARDALNLTLGDAKSIYGRCPNCRRKLVRNGEKGGAT